MPEQELGLHLPPGSAHYRAYVGYPATYDIIAAMQFNLLTFLGLRDRHKLLDIGCGSLRAGRLLIPYLQQGHYFGIEPEEWLVAEGIERETGNDLVQIKQPSFAFRSDYKLTCFETSFDFILAQSIFSHAGARDIERCLKEAAVCLGPGGVMVASFILDRADYEGDAWVYPTCVGYKESTIRRLAADAKLGFRVIDWPHPNAQTWALFWREETRKEPDDPTYALTLPVFERKAPHWIREETGAGFFDGVWDVGEAWLACGWAVDPSRSGPPPYVIVTDETRIIAVGPVGVARDDVAGIYGAACLRSGFRVRLSKSACPPGSNLRCFAYIPETEQAFILSGTYSI